MVSADACASTVGEASPDAKSGGCAGAEEDADADGAAPALLAAASDLAVGQENGRPPGADFFDLDDAAVFDVLDLPVVLGAVATLGVDEGAMLGAAVGAIDDVLLAAADGAMLRALDAVPPEAAADALLGAPALLGDFAAGAVLLEALDELDELEELGVR
jgi:hypothetical protein